VKSVRLYLRLAGAILATAFCAAVPAVVRLLTFGAMRPASRVGAWSCWLWGRWMRSILGLRVQVEGSPPRGLFLLASNHLSYLDIMVLGSLAPSLFVAKREIRSWPLFGWMSRGAGTLFVDRERPKDVVRVAGEMVERLEAGLSLTLFPEGKSTRGIDVHPFMPSLLEAAARTGVPCHAVTLRYDAPDFENLPPSVTVCWYDRAPFVPHITRLMRLSGVTARVRFNGPALRSDDRKLLARELRVRVAAAFEPVRQVVGDEA
jgi:1-acyl-sn-glycerol-3-phosphate acyltransferase